MAWYELLRKNVWYIHKSQVYTIIIFCIYTLYMRGGLIQVRWTPPFEPLSQTFFSRPVKGHVFIKRFGWRDKSFLPSFTTLSLAAPHALSSECRTLRMMISKSGTFLSKKCSIWGIVQPFCFFFGGGGVYRQKFELEVQWTYVSKRFHATLASFVFLKFEDPKTWSFF